MMIASSIVAICMGFMVIFIRMKAQKRPVSGKKIILPPLFMSTGALMFLFPVFRVNISEFLEAITVGMVFSLLLIKTSKFEIRENDIYLKRSKAFAFILIGLLLIRIVAKSILSASIDYGELSGMFWILAFGMIVPWRITMYFQYKKLHQENQDLTTNSI
ncbi:MULTISPECIES: CcdC family protein [Bacillaceae]|uniref:CcdC family protein n=1 Tax=Bacillaceae TaxID=186817 RepID=UPI001C59ACE1|nr:cytochrome c biogenesis protein CcdC [Rossellomorea sp. YZS02]MBW3113723.1 cytochrome c biogenesis protein CcdC [Bacillus sp. MCCB 382]MDX8346347.1 cytochrome c biogenesis protein CcdC [Rossellomorea sp. YZS02]